MHMCDEEPMCNVWAAEFLAICMSEGEREFERGKRELERKDREREERGKERENSIVMRTSEAGSGHLVKKRALSLLIGPW